jgi:hypothetical protein
LANWQQRRAGIRLGSSSSRLDLEVHQMPGVTTGTTHNTADRQFVTADVEFACRRVDRPGTLPLVLLQRFRGNLDIAAEDGQTR